MSGSTTQTRNIADLVALSSPANLVLLARRGAGELVGLDPAAIEGSGGGGAGTAGPAGPQGPQGPQGPAGADGEAVLNGFGAPADTLGQNGDFYIDLNGADRPLYGPKANGVWPGSPYPLKGPQGNQGTQGAQGTAGTAGPAGAAGNTILSGSGGPSNALGQNGDFYLDRASADYLLYGPKSAGAWGTGFALKGSGAGPAGPTGATGAPGEDGTDILTGTGAPANTLGKNGDVYLDLNSADRLLYGPKAAGAWPSQTYPLRGTQGPQGVQGAQGAAGAQGQTGPAGAAVRSGNGAPAASLGANGDFYIDLASANYLLYGPKASGAWPTTTYALKGPAGATGPAGPAGANATLGTTAGLALTASGAAGAATTAARSDHTHPRPTPADIGAAPSAHTHDVSAINNLQTALDGKAGVNHTHAMDAVTGLSTALAGKEDTSKRGQANGYAALDATGKVPAAQLPAATGGGGTGTGVDPGTKDGQVYVWNQSLAKGVWEDQTSIVADRDPVVELNTAAALTFAAHHRRILVLSASTPLTLAASEAGAAPYQGFSCLIENDYAGTNTVTFGAGIAVKQPANGTGTAGVVKMPPDGQLSVVVYPKGSGLVAKCRGDVS